MLPQGIEPVTLHLLGESDTDVLPGHNICQQLNILSDNQTIFFSLQQFLHDWNHNRTTHVEDDISVLCDGTDRLM